MTSLPMYLGSTPLQEGEAPVQGDFVTLGSERFYRIANYDRMDPFFMSVVSGSNHWMFISSKGGLSAGRRNADNALFPYYTSDRIHDDAEHTGSRTILRVHGADRRHLWEPFAGHCGDVYRLSRNLYKNVYGNVLVFEEVNHDLDLVFRYSWAPSDRFGWVKSSELSNTGDAPVSVDVLDGIQNILPWGVQEAFQSRFSVLGDAYKENELEAETGLAIYSLSSRPGDSSDPAEALRATVAWSDWPSTGVRLVSSLQLDRFRRGEEIQPETRVCGRRGAFFVSDTVELAPGKGRDWVVVTDLEYGLPEIAALRPTLLGERPGSVVREDVAESTRRLVGIIARADGLQTTGDRLSSAHHFANVLFNVMRGGVFENAYELPVDDLKDFVRSFNREAWKRHEAFLNGLGDRVELGNLLQQAGAQDDPTLLRLVTEYLPLSFSRRHGDPSRPWNRFSIELQERDGSRILAYEGNWRDIFQNWEALCLSFPEYLEGIIGKFVNTTTADGYNPYRVTQDGYDWEKPDPDEPWANLGYWGDHQIIYLLKLLEWSRAHHPDRLQGMLRSSHFVYADVPYDIKPYADLLADPRKSIAYNDAREERIDARVSAVGFDGRYLTDSDGEICRANLTEKLLVPLLAKLGNFVPEAGFWMNTQRPEWNDANNALAGLGASMVTLFYARRYVTFCLELFDGLGEGEVEVNDQVARWLEATHGVLAQHRGLLEGDLDDGQRKAVLDGLGLAAEDYRLGVYRGGLSGGSRSVNPATLRDFLEVSLAYLDHSIERNRRDDGLYHAYNVLGISDEGIAVERLYAMLEGQVAVLSSGYLEPREAQAVLTALRESELYRADQHSYLLYPDRTLPRFLAKNTIPPSLAERSRLFAALVTDGNGDLVERDRDGHLHFNGTFKNVRDVRAALDALRDEGYADLVEQDSELVAQIFEDVFDHKYFTGRSGTFYGYEGLGCIYWHQVSKLLLAVQECALVAAHGGEPEFPTLAEWYYDVRAGLGFNKDPEVFGAFPTDPYSHTPGHAGAKQPGMTGQVKEEVVTRLGELGLSVEGGRIRFRPFLLRAGEFLDAPETFHYHDVRGDARSISLDAGTLGFTHCQVPVIYRMGEGNGIILHLADGERLEVEGMELDPATSAEIFRRTGAITRIEVSLTPGLEA